MDEREVAAGGIWSAFWSFLAPVRGDSPDDVLHEDISENPGAERECGGWVTRLRGQIAQQRECLEAKSNGR